ncbi:unnamed protein product [Mytilus edulis]|uniref:B box-type domain-containing protein n=1 Tax=Mytilus edulis TaxID=6550 RepID=A0A8S3RQ28_MYTED|nr:unnamed protein product [Mytilus edulis]
MAEKIICRSEPTLYCRLHTMDTYQLYCKDCQDFVCFVCLGEFHEKHNFCRLQDIEVEIRNQFSILFSENDNYIKQIDEFRQIIYQNMKQLSVDEGKIEHQIKINAEKMIAHIHLQEKFLLSELHTMFKNFKISSQDLTSRADNLQSNVTKFDVDKLPEIKLEEMIYILSELKACTVSCDKMKNYQKPNFNTDLKSSNAMVDVEVSESIHMTSTMHFSVSTQTKDHDDSDTEDEWFDAEDDVDEDFIERSSDEINVDKTLHVYKLNKEIGRIKKMCPLSHTDAWILADQKLYKMIKQSLDDTVYADDADDIAVLKDGCVLILRHNSTIIMKLLENRRLVRFANIGVGSLLPCCFCNSIDDSLTVYLFRKQVMSMRGVLYK